MSSRTVVRASKSSANDLQLKVVSLGCADGNFVRSGQRILEIEGAKAVVEIDAATDGKLYFLVKPGDLVTVGAALAVICEKDTSREEALLGIESATVDERPSPNVRADGPVFTRAALDLLAKRQLDPAAFAGQQMVTAKMVEAYGVETECKVGLSIAGSFAAPLPSPLKHSPLLRPRERPNGRLALIGGGQGAIQLMAALDGDAETEVVAIFDDNSSLWGQRLLGAPVVGPVTQLTEYAEARKLDSVMVATSRNKEFRTRIAGLVHSLGLNLGNAIHPTAHFDAEVVIGAGNFIGAYCYFGPQTVVGDMGYFSSRANFEHHNRIGNSVTTGPSVTTSGGVVIGDNVTFGTGISIEPDIKIGSNSVIASGLSITSDIPPGSVCKARQPFTLRGH